MELDHLITNLKKPEENSPVFLAIEIGLETVKAATWQIASGKPQFLKSGGIEEVNPNSVETLLPAVDLTVTKAQEGSPSEPKQVIFSLPESWVKGGDIDKSKKVLLKNITDKLDLKPAGFVVTVEALVHYLQDKQGGPITTILLGLTETDVTVTLVETGQIAGTHTVGRSDDLGADVEEGLARFGSKDSLPASMILYDGHTDLESEKQVLISYDWQDHLPFLHIPKIENLGLDETIHAAVAAGGVEVIKSLADVSEPDSPPPKVEKDPIPDRASEFGFTNQGALPKRAAKAPSQTQDAGFVIHDLGEIGQDDDRTAPAKDSKFPQNPFASVVHKPDFLKRVSLGHLRFPSRRRPLIFVAAILTVLFSLTIGVVYAYWQLPQAEVTLFIAPETITTDLTFTIDPKSAEISLDTSLIPGLVQTFQVAGEKESPVTGEKLVGDVAGGTATIYNRTNYPKTFNSATKLTGPDGLVYTLDQDVTIASASTKENPDLSITTEPSSSTVPISAVNIGAKYNLGAGTQFKVANFDSTSFLARAASDLTGGTSRQITAVSPEDQAALKTALLADLQQQIAAKVNQTGVGNAVSAIPLVDLKDQELAVDYSAGLGAEATSLTAHASLSLEAMTYKKSDLALLIEKKIKGDLADNFHIDPTGITLDVSQSDPDPDTAALTITGTSHAKVVPSLNKDDIKNTIRGHFPTSTQSYFDGLPNFQRVEIKITPEFIPVLIKTFPHILSHITVNIETTQ